jgi:hypothetical protein
MEAPYVLDPSHPIVTSHTDFGKARGSGKRVIGTRGSMEYPVLKFRISVDARGPGKGTRLGG